MVIKMFKARYREKNLKITRERGHIKYRKANTGIKKK